MKTYKIYYTPICLGMGNPSSRYVGQTSSIVDAQKLAKSDSVKNDRILYHYYWVRKGKLFGVDGKKIK